MYEATQSTRRLVGRRRELELLASVVEGAGSGVSGVVELRGEPGIGITQAR
jgi:hypothetical protein